MAGVLVGQLHQAALLAARRHVRGDATTCGLRQDLAQEHAVLEAGREENLPRKLSGRLFALAQVVTGREAREQRRVVFVENVVEANGVTPEQASAPDLEDHCGRKGAVPSEADDVVITPAHLLDALLTRQAIQPLDHVPEVSCALEIERL